MIRQAAPLVGRVCGVLIAVAVAAVLALPSAAAARGLTTGISDPLEPVFAERDGIAAYHRARVAGISVVRVPVEWRQVAPAAPASATDPADSAYRWRLVDDQVERIVANGMQPMLTVLATPSWATKRGMTPHAGDLGAFMTAIARRYDGSSRPRVRFWQLWNEPNLWQFLDPDPGQYRAMLRAADPAVHAVHADNVLAAGGLGPFAGPRGRYGMAPLKYMRRLLARKTPFDAWSHHPYTSGPPARHAFARNDVSLGDLPEMRAELVRARAAGRIRSTRFWVTEFSWDTKPPDPRGVPVREHARWVAEALYRMWRSGVDLVVWFQLRDNPHDGFRWGQTWQSGLYFRTTPLYADEKPKPALRAFRFPFVALPARGRIVLWGRTPDSSAGRVLIERRVRRRWRGAVVLRADGDGIFRGSIRARRGTLFRAGVGGGDTSLPFTARRTRNRHVNPFGGQGSLSERD